MTSVCCVSPLRSDTPTPFFQSVFRHRISTWISSKSVSTLDSEERLSKVTLPLFHCVVSAVKAQISLVSSRLLHWFLFNFIWIQYIVSRCQGRGCEHSTVDILRSAVGWNIYFAATTWTPYSHLLSGASSRQKCGVDTHGDYEERAYITGVWGQSPHAVRSRATPNRGQNLWSWKPFSCWMPKGSSKFDSFSVFCELPSQAPNLTHPPRTPVKCHQICTNRRYNLWKSGVDMMSTSVHLVQSTKNVSN